MLIQIIPWQSHAPIHLGFGRMIGVPLPFSPLLDLLSLQSNAFYKMHNKKPCSLPLLAEPKHQQAEATATFHSFPHESNSEKTFRFPKG